MSRDDDGPTMADHLEMQVGAARHAGPDVNDRARSEARSLERINAVQSSRVAASAVATAERAQREQDQRDRAAERQAASDARKVAAAAHARTDAGRAAFVRHLNANRSW